MTQRGHCVINAASLIYPRLKNNSPRLLLIMKRQS